MKFNEKGLTLVEVVIIIAILGILASIVMSQFNVYEKKVISEQKTHIGEIKKQLFFIWELDIETVDKLKVINNFPANETANFIYKISAGEIQYKLFLCIKATRKNETRGYILYSSLGGENEGWEETYNTVSFLTGEIPLAGGVCNPDGSFRSLGGE